MAKEKEKKFISSINVEDFNPVDGWMVIKNPFRKESPIITSEDPQMNTREPSTVIKVGRYIDDIEPGMEVYYPSDTEGLKIQEDVIRGMVEKFGLDATIAKQNGQPVPMEEGIKGYYDYYVINRTDIIGYRDLRNKQTTTDES